MKSNQLLLNDLKVNYVDINNNNYDKIILFIPGAGGCIKNWKHQIAFFSKNYRVIAYDPICHGESEFVRNYTFDNHYNDFIDIIEKLQLDKEVILVTHSSSTQIAIRYLKENCNKIGKIVLVSAALYDNDGFLWMLFISLPTFIGKTLYKLILSINKIAVTKKLFFSKNTPNELVEEFLKENGIPSFETLQIFKSYAHFDASPYVKDLKKKVIVVAGDEDWAVPYKKSIQLHEKLNNGEIFIMHGVGHMCYYEDFKNFNAILEHFIDEK